MVAQRTAIRQLSLTECQRSVHVAITDYVANEGLPPTRLELMELLGWRSASNLNRVIGVLARKGYLRRRPGARGLVPVAG